MDTHLLARASHAPVALLLATAIALAGPGALAEPRSAEEEPSDEALLSDAAPDTSPAPDARVGERSSAPSALVPPRAGDGGGAPTEGTPLPPEPPGPASIKKFAGYAATWGDWCDEDQLPIQVLWTTVNAATIQLTTDVAIYGDLPAEAVDFQACSQGTGHHHFIELKAVGGGGNEHIYGRTVSLVPR